MFGGSGFGTGGHGDADTRTRTASTREWLRHLRANHRRRRMSRRLPAGVFVSLFLVAR